MNIKTRRVRSMEWNIKNNPTFKDISANRSPYFLTVRRHSAFVAKDYYNSRLDKWFKTNDCTEEVPVAAWMPLPKFDYDLINNESKLDCESSQIIKMSTKVDPEFDYDVINKESDLNNRKNSGLIDYFVDLITKTDPISPYVVVQEFSPDFEVSAEVKNKVGDFTFKYI